MTKPFINHGPDKLTCRYCGETVLPGETHTCQTKIDKTLQAVARLLLYSQGWGKDAIEAALNPTEEQAKERGRIPVAEVNPEQHLAIRILHQLGWGSHKIEQVIPVPPAEVTRVIKLDWKG